MLELHTEVLLMSLTKVLIASLEPVLLHLAVKGVFLSWGVLFAALLLVVLLFVLLLDTATLSIFFVVGSFAAFIASDWVSVVAKGF